MTGRPKKSETPRYKYQDLKDQSTASPEAQVWLPSKRGYYQAGRYYTANGEPHNRSTMDEAYASEFFEEMLCYFDDGSEDKYFLKEFYNKKKTTLSKVDNLLRSFSTVVLSNGMSLLEARDFCKQICEINLSKMAMTNGRAFAAVQLFLQNHHDYAIRKESKSENRNITVNQSSSVSDMSEDALREKLRERLS